VKITIRVKTVKKKLSPTKTGIRPKMLKKPTIDKKPFERRKV
jgi:hypothetical protein